MKVWYRIAFSLIMGLIVCLLWVVAWPLAAHAGTNGQQVVFTLDDNGCQGASNLGSVQISGTNQDGQYVTWQGTSSDGHSVFTANWWWVGNVSITYQVDSGINQTVGFVPVEASDDYPGSNQDYVFVTCRGTLKSAYVRIEDGLSVSAACINLEDNPLGYMTQYVNYSGYNYVGKDGAFVGSAIGENGQSVPTDVTYKYLTYECGLPSS